MVMGFSLMNWPHRVTSYQPDSQFQRCVIRRVRITLALAPQAAPERPVLPLDVAGFVAHCPGHVRP